MKKRVVVCMLITSVLSIAISGSVFAQEPESPKTGTMDTGVRILAGLTSALSTVLTYDPGGTGFNDTRIDDKSALQKFEKSAQERASQARQSGKDMKVFFEEEAKELKSLKRAKGKSNAIVAVALTYAALSGTYSAVGADNISKGFERVSDVLNKAPVGLSTEKAPRASQDAFKLN